MRVLEAKDFLVQQTAEQAALEGVSLSDLEKRMMYFTDVEECPTDPIKLNEEFEAVYDNDEFEGKISKLMHHAYKRFKKENTETARRWNAAVRVLRKGDHYLLVLWDLGPQERPPYDSLKLFGTAILAIVVGGGVMWAWMFLADHFNIHWKSGPDVHRFAPEWLPPLFWLLVICGYLRFVVWPWALKRPPVGFCQLAVKLVGALLKNRERKVGRSLL